jgi:hypothetical protein
MAVLYVSQTAQVRVALHVPTEQVPAGRAGSWLELTYVESRNQRSQSLGLRKRLKSEREEVWEVSILFVEPGLNLFAGHLSPGSTALQGFSTAHLRIV